jgi:hypothetical protein
VPSVSCEDSIRKESGIGQDRNLEEVVIHAAYMGKVSKTIPRKAETRWRLWLVALAVALGILAGALASGRISLHIHQ